MPGKEVYLTREGFEKLRKELEHLSTVRRHSLSREIGTARELGDLRENAEYKAAKEAQALNETRVAELENKLSNVRFIDDMKIPSDKIYLGAKIVLQDPATKEEVNRMLVSGEEADIEIGKISISSPIGKALLGHKEGDVVTIDVPAGKVTYKVLKISR